MTRVMTAGFLYCLTQDLQCLPILYFYIFLLISIMNFRVSLYGLEIRPYISIIKGGRGLLQDIVRQLNITTLLCHF